MKPEQRRAWQHAVQHPPHLPYLQAQIPPIPGMLSGAQVTTAASVCSLSLHVAPHSRDMSTQPQSGCLCQWLEPRQSLPDRQTDRWTGSPRPAREAPENQLPLLPIHLSAGKGPRAMMLTPDLSASVSSPQIRACVNPLTRSSRP